MPDYTDEQFWQDMKDYVSQLPHEFEKPEPTIIIIESEDDNE